jgi:uroporphyrin-III C-methyltransferase
MSIAIVGAGPGDPKLITVRGLELLRRCEILIYDRLAPVELVLNAEQAVRIARDRLSQQEVNSLLIRYGQLGRRLVRLKNGDPFLFGRGSEEVDALDAAGLPYELVPGLSTLTAIPTLAGIPLTARGEASQLTVLTGSSADGTDLDYPHLAATPGTLVIFMGLKRLAHIADELILAGRRLDEPAAVISRLSLPDSEIRTGTLATIAANAAGMATPAVVIIGDVVARSDPQALTLAFQTPSNSAPRLSTAADEMPSELSPFRHALQREHARRSHAIAFAVDRLLARVRRTHANDVAPSRPRQARNTEQPPSGSDTA